MVNTVQERRISERPLLAISGIDEVSTGIIEGIQELEGRFLVHTPHAKLLPLVPDAHTTELERGNMD